MNKQLKLIQSEPSLVTLPTAKVKAQDKAGVHSWTNFYASFSEKFVTEAFTALDIKTTDIVLDPFVGSGTTLVAAKKLGIHSIGMDIDPFSCLLSRAKLANNFDRKKLEKLLRKTKSEKISKKFSDEAKQLFNEDCLAYASAVFNRVECLVSESDNALELILNDKGSFDSEVLALTALCIGAAEASKLIKGSNPTWFRKAMSGEKDNLKKLYMATQEVKERMISDLSKVDYSAADATLILDDSKTIKTHKKITRADFIITSPPYLTRIDYAMKHYPYLAILSGFHKFDFNNLRKKMIGTAKIVDKKEANPNCGKLCLGVLDRIREHSSYASESYYVWTYQQYFKSLSETFDKFKYMLNSKGKGLIVLQDSFYKDVHIPLSDIAVEMLTLKGFKSYIVQRDCVKTNMKNLNPAHQKKNITRKSSEDVIYFSL